MSRHLSPLAAKLRCELLRRPGFTRLPVCGACGRETEPRNFGREYCKPCEAERLEASAYFQRLNDETDWPVLPAPEYPMFGSAEAERPFLVEDDGEEGPF